MSIAQGPSQQEVTQTLGPLFTYFDENFAIMKQTLTDAAMIMVMTRLWKEALSTIESLLVPPLSDKLSQQRPLTQQELDIVFKWLKMLFDFFHAADEDGNVDGVPMDVLKSPKYHELQNLNFFYFEATEDLIRTSESMAAASARRQQEQAQRLHRMSAPPTMGPQFGGAAGLSGMPTRKHKTIMLSRNLGTMKKAKEEKRKEAQAEPNDDMILRILRMRPEAERYLKDRSRQKVRRFLTFILISERLWLLTCGRNVSLPPKLRR
jgi:GAF domain-containing protein